MRRQTLCSATPKLHGIGLHTGAPGWVRLMPLFSNNRNNGMGLLFQSAKTGEAYQVSPDLVTDTRRCTALKLGGERLSTVEHLLAALTGCGVTDAVIEYSAVEVPILDGSALGFSEAIRSVGACEALDKPDLDPIRITEAIVVLGEQGERLVALPSETFSVTVVLDYPEHAEIGTQAARYDSESLAFDSEIAPARTYGFLSEFEQVRRLGLASGASLDNCIALQDDGSPDERTPLRYTNELARHKLLDVLGDLTLTGRPILADVIAVRPSHTVNCLLAKRLTSFMP